MKGVFMPLNKERVFCTPKEMLRPNEIPSVMVVGKNLPEAWELAVLATMEFGCHMPTLYDSEGDPESKAVSMVMTVANPFAEPRIHKCIPDSLEGLQIYVQEVVDGVHDNRVRKDGWSYSYHDRLRCWPGVDGWEQIEELIIPRFGIDLSQGGREDVHLRVALPRVDQIKTMVESLAAEPYTRRVQAITWNPLKDAGHQEPPCLQRVWCQVVESGDELLLQMNTNWRSRDAFKAAFMNMVALTELQRQMAERISEVLGKKVGVGRYVDFSDNYHVYGSYLRRGEMVGFLQSLQKRSFEERTMRSDSEQMVEARARAEEILKEERAKQEG